MGPSPSSARTHRVRHVARDPPPPQIQLIGSIGELPLGEHPHVDRNSQIRPQAPARLERRPRSIDLRGEIGGVPVGRLRRELQEWPAGLPRIVDQRLKGPPARRHPRATELDHGGRLPVRSHLTRAPDETVRVEVSAPPGSMTEAATVPTSVFGVFTVTNLKILFSRVLKRTLPALKYPVLYRVLADSK